MAIRSTLLVLLFSQFLIKNAAAATTSASTLPIATAAAVAAGRHIIARVGAQPIATKLDSADLVTEVDRECEEIIRSHIRAAFPSHGLLGEESVEPGVDAAMAALAQLQEAHDWVWIVDPIDGTTNFVNGLPLCAVSVGVAHKGERMGAVVYDPFREELYTAWRGEGATLNGEPMAASGVGTMRDAVLCAPSPHAGPAIGPALRSISALMPKARSIRILGSGVLNFCWVACGRLSAYWEPELAPWDTAAGTLLIEEAGGTVSDMDGSTFGLSTRAVLGSAKGIHDELLGELKDAEAVRCDTRS